ncbi:MAG TPA: hypothetical protein VH143_01170 [Kofleriaceae bacterium]|nr:hypothetical protein [Kofleriaceae bacterium]
MRSEVSEGREHYRPDVVVVVDARSHFVLATELAKPGKAPDVAAAVVRGALANTVAPARIRVATPELKDALDDFDVDIVVGDTREANEVLAALETHLDRRTLENTEDSYLHGGVTARDLAPLFTAAARLYRAKPWAAIPADECLAVDCAALGIRDGRLTVVGQMGQSFGFALYPDRAAFEAIGELADDPDGEIPPQIMFTFDARSDIGRQRADEVRRHKWALAGPSAYPSAVRIEGRDRVFELKRDELAAITAVADTLATLVEETSELARRWNDLPPVRVDSIGEPRVTLVAPEPLVYEIAHEPHEAELAALLRAPLITAKGEIDDARCQSYLAAVEQAFERAPESQGIEPTWAAMFTELAAQFAGKTLGQLSPDEVRELAFGYIPRKISVSVDEAPAIIASIRALLAFAAREIGGYAPNRCLAQLPARSVEMLADELGDSNNFGPAKQLIMQGIAAGYDMTSEAGVAAWVAAVNKSRKPAARKKTPARKKPAKKKKR